jgi:hypothetical protein
MLLQTRLYGLNTCGHSTEMRKPGSDKRIKLKKSVRGEQPLMSSNKTFMRSII